MLNLRLMSNWQNWATILLMVMIASFAGRSILQLSRKQPE